MADATDKIEWLIAHDDMAQRIAKNGLNFGKNELLYYLRYFLFFQILNREVVLKSRGLLLLRREFYADVR
jgi:hypothetical protein